MASALQDYGSMNRTVTFETMGNQLPIKQHRSLRKIAPSSAKKLMTRPRSGIERDSSAQKFSDSIKNYNSQLRHSLKFVKPEQKSASKDHKSLIRTLERTGYTKEHIFALWTSSLDDNKELSLLLDRERASK